jgi:subtilisin
MGQILSAGTRVNREADPPTAAVARSRRFTSTPPRTYFFVGMSFRRFWRGVAHAACAPVAVIAALGIGPATSDAGANPGAYIVVLKTSVADPAAVAREQARKTNAQVSYVYSHALKGYAAALPATTLSAVEADPRVAFVAADDQFRLTDLGATSPASASPSGISPTCLPGSVPDLRVAECLPAAVDRVDGDRSSTRSGDGRGAVDLNVAVVDSGVDPTHPDLNVVGGTNCGGNSGDFSDDVGHGTEVAGVIGARDNGFGVVGIAPGARLWAAKVDGNGGSTTTSRLVCAIDWVTATRTDGDATNDIAVANMSLESKGKDDGNCGRTNKDALHLAICASVSAGVAWVVAAGNGTADFGNVIPASYDEVVTATAMADFDGQPGGSSAPMCFAGDLPERDDYATTFSNFATAGGDRAHVVAASGSCVVTTQRGGSYGFDSGTSFASPAVAGTVALCIAGGGCAGLRPQQIVAKIVADAAAYNTSHPAYGFAGDPLHSPDPSRYYGYLVRAGLY